jgi:hypothetical protein
MKAIILLVTLMLSLGGMTGCGENPIPAGQPQSSVVIVETKEVDDIQEAESVEDSEPVTVINENTYSIDDLIKWKNEYDNAPNEQERDVVAKHIRIKFETFDQSLIKDEALKAFLNDILEVK